MKRLLLVLVGLAFGGMFLAGQAQAATCEGCTPGTCCSQGYQCKLIASNCYSCVSDNFCGALPTPTPTPANPPTPTPGESAGGGGGGGGSTPAPTVGSSTPTPTPDQCAVDCNHEVCGATSASCTTDADCGPGSPRCINGKCNKCTNPGTACCGYCVPQGWGCTSTNCDKKMNCKGWDASGNLCCDETITCGGANPCAQNPAGWCNGPAASSTCYECFDDCHDVPAPTLTPTPGPFSCSDLQVTNLYKQNNNYNMAQATVRNDSRYAVYITKTWFSWYDGVEPQGGAVDYFFVPSQVCDLAARCDAHRAIINQVRRTGKVQRTLIPNTDESQTRIGMAPLNPPARGGTSTCINQDGLPL